MSASRDNGPPESVEELQKEIRSLREQLQKALAENQRLPQQLEEALRSLKRQAAPFSKGEPKPHPKQPGRKPGAEYGQRASRPVPQRVDEEFPVPLPERCLSCGGPVVYAQTESQFQEDSVRRTVVRRFQVQIGRCACCRRRVQGRHPLQTSDAVGVAQVQLGPEALALAAHLNKEMGISHQRVARALELGYGLKVNRSTLCRALLRLGQKAEPTYQQLRVAVRESPVNWLDETGWRESARLKWLWVALSRQVTVYAILPGRGFAQAAELLGEDYAGFLHHDGWRPYYRFLQAGHQSCLSHLLHRCHNLLEVASPAAAGLPQTVLQLLHTGLALRDRYRLDPISPHGLAVATGRLEASMNRLLQKSFRSPLNCRLAKHLRHEQPYLFSFLRCPDFLDATNNAAERALRPAVIARKTWGGNRTPAGAQSQQILASILRTCWQQSKDTFPRFTQLLRSRQPMILDIIPVSQSP